MAYLENLPSKIKVKDATSAFATINNHNPTLKNVIGMLNGYFIHVSKEKYEWLLWDAIYSNEIVWKRKLQRIAIKPQFLMFIYGNFGSGQLKLDPKPRVSVAEKKNSNFKKKHTASVECGPSLLFRHSSETFSKFINPSTKYLKVFNGCKN